MTTTAILNHPLDTSAAEADLLAMADRLDLGPAIVTGGEVDLAALSRLQAQTARPCYPHNTPMERLWLEYDPEYPAYAQAMQDARTKSRRNRKAFFVLTRVAGWRTNRRDTEPRFDVKAAKSPAAAYAAFRADSDVVAIARAGTILACKK